MKRLFWVGVGVAIGVSATRKVSAATQRATPAGFGASLGEGLRELGTGLGQFGAEVRAGMAEREDELTAMVEGSTGIGVGASGRGDPGGRHTAPIPVDPTTPAPEGPATPAERHEAGGARPRQRARRGGH